MTPALERAVRSVNCVSFANVYLVFVCTFPFGFEGCDRIRSWQLPVVLLYIPGTSVRVQQQIYVIHMSSNMCRRINPSLLFPEILLEMLKRPNT